jgi:hypothetical protein
MPTEVRIEAMARDDERTRREMERGAAVLAIRDLSKRFNPDHQELEFGGAYKPSALELAHREEYRRQMIENRRRAGG